MTDSKETVMNEGYDKRRCDIPPLNLLIHLIQLTVLIEIA